METNSWKEFYPTLSEDELRLACENLDAYLELAWEIYQDSHQKMEFDLNSDGS